MAKKGHSKVALKKMKESAAAKGKKVGSGAAATLAAGKQSSSTAIVPYLPAEETLAVASGAKRARSQQDRRDLNQRAERALQNKLVHIPEAVWRAKRTDDGQSCIEYIAAAQAKLRGEQKKMGTKFWTDFFQVFALIQNVTDDLPDPKPVKGEVKVDSGLSQALVAANCGNPAGSPSAELERYLETCQELTEVELFGLLRAIMVSPSMPLGVAMRCQVAALQYFARTFRSLGRVFVNVFLCSQALERGVAPSLFAQCSGTLCNILCSLRSRCLSRVPLTLLYADGGLSLFNRAWYSLVSNPPKTSPAIPPRESNSRHVVSKRYRYSVAR